jgi:hypothetical protein
VEGALTWGLKKPHFGSLDVVPILSFLVGDYYFIPKYRKQKVKNDYVGITEDYSVRPYKNFMSHRCDTPLVEEI